MLAHVFPLASLPLVSTPPPADPRVPSSLPLRGAGTVDFRGEPGNAGPSRRGSVLIDDGDDEENEEDVDAPSSNVSSTRRLLGELGKAGRGWSGGFSKTSSLLLAPARRRFGSETSFSNLAECKNS